MEEKIRKAFEVADELAQKAIKREAQTQYYGIIFPAVFHAMLADAFASSASNRTAAGLAQAEGESASE